jgi:cytidyltransferase-like protein
MKKVLVSGCFDLFHAGHVAFLKEASSYGTLYVAVGSDKNVQLLKGKAPYFSQAERCFIINSSKYVEEAFVASGTGLLDFVPDAERLKPDIFIVNSDGDSEGKREFCESRKIQYLVLNRIPEKGLPAKSSSSIKKELKFPYRVCLAGGWVDQPWASKICAGSVVVARIHPTVEFNERSGMATSSRKIASDLWDGRFPDGDPFQNARLLFGAENPPGTKNVSGSQDHIGLLAPGINRLFYTGDYWPAKIDNTTDPETCHWLSQRLHFIRLKPRPSDYDPLSAMNLQEDWIGKLGEAGDLCWRSILSRDLVNLGKAMTQTFEMWQLILPRTVPDWVIEVARQYASCPGLVTSGSGGGYLVIASEKEIPGAIKINVSFQNGGDFRVLPENTGAKEFREQKGIRQKTEETRKESALSTWESTSAAQNSSRS